MLLYRRPRFLTVSQHGKGIWQQTPAFCPGSYILLQGLGAPSVQQMTGKSTDRRLIAGIREHKSVQCQLVRTCDRHISLPHEVTLARRTQQLRCMDLGQGARHHCDAFALMPHSNLGRSMVFRPAALLAAVTKQRVARRSPGMTLMKRDSGLAAGREVADLQQAGPSAKDFCD